MSPASACKRPTRRNPRWSSLPVGSSLLVASALAGFVACSADESTAPSASAGGANAGAAGRANAGGNGAAGSTAGMGGKAGQSAAGQGGVGGSNGAAGGSAGTGSAAGHAGSNDAGGGAGSGGSSGSSGKAGAGGSSGASGKAGAGGSSGASGKAGAGGSSGASGKAGAGGSSGASGKAGAGGSSGSSGKAGASGAAGSGPGGGKLIFSESFDDVATIPSALGAGAQGGGTIQLASDPSGVYGGKGKSLRATYPATTGEWGGTPVWAGVDLSPYATDHVYIRFRVKLPGYKYGSKFLKVFSINDDTSGYANTTFGLNNDASTYLIFGDGSELENDAGNKINYDGSDPSWVGRAFGKPGYAVETPQKKNWTAADWGDDWHLFEVYMKFNSGTSAANETNDGAYFVRIDGRVYVDAKGLFNRHWSNQPMGSVGLFGWAQGKTAMPGFEIWLDDIQVSLGGWL